MRLAQPHPTDNYRKDVIRWVKKGDCIVLHAGHKYAKIYHQCKNQKNLENIRVIYLDLIHISETPVHGGWPEIMQEANCEECACEIRAKVLDPKNIPHFYSFELVKTRLAKFGQSLSVM